MNVAIPTPIMTDDRTRRERLEDARCALECLHDILCHVGPHDQGLSCLGADHLAGFLRLVLAQFPPD